jgi:hypothetical protein
MTLKVKIVPDFLLQKDPLANVYRLEEGLDRFLGWILSLADYTMLIKDEAHQRSFYVRTCDIVERLCAVPKYTSDVRIGPSTKKIHQLVLKNLNPVLGEDIPLEKVTRFFNEFRSCAFINTLISSKDGEEASVHVIERLEQFSEKDITVIPFSQSAILEHLQPGDIIFKKLEADQESIVIFGQKLLVPFTPGKKEREGYNFSHVLIYLGDGKVAEAHDGDHMVRKVDISHLDFIINPSSTREYRITRCKDTTLAHQAAQIAASMAKDPEENQSNPKKLKYDRLLAVQSLFHTPVFGLFARYRYLKHYIDDRNNELSAGFFESKSFFCSHLIPFCYQVAESRSTMNQLLPREDLPSQGHCRFGTALRRGLWAHVRSWKLWNAMSENILFTIDAKRTTPHELRNFVVKKPDLFHDLYLIKAPALSNKG